MSFLIQMSVKIKWRKHLCDPYEEVFSVVVKQGERNYFVHLLIFLFGSIYVNLQIYYLFFSHFLYNKTRKEKKVAFFLSIFSSVKKLKIIKKIYCLTFFSKPNKTLVSSIHWVLFQVHAVILVNKIGNRSKYLLSLTLVVLYLYIPIPS